MRYVPIVLTLTGNENETDEYIVFEFRSIDLDTGEEVVVSGTCAAGPNMQRLPAIPEHKFIARIVSAAWSYVDPDQER